MLVLREMELERREEDIISVKTLIRGSELLLEGGDTSGRVNIYRKDEVARRVVSQFHAV